MSQSGPQVTASADPSLTVVTKRKPPSISPTEWPALADGEVRFYGEVDASPDSMRRLAVALAGTYQRLHFCYG